MLFNPATDCKIISVEAAAAAGTTDLTSDVVDCEGYETVTFIAAIGTITSGAVTSLVGYTHTADAASGSAVTGATVTIADTDSGKLAVLTMQKPQKRYAYAVLDRGTQNAVHDRMICILSNPTKAPTSHGSNVITPVTVTA